MNTTSSTSTPPITKRQYCVIDITKSCSKHEHQRADRRSRKRAAAAKHRHEHEIARMGPIGQFGIGQSGGDGEDGSADAAIHRRDHEGGEPHPENLHADIGGLAGVLADRAQMQPERRLGDAPHRQAEQRKQHQRIIVERPGQKRGLAAAPLHAEQQRPQHPHALIAAGDAVELEQEGMKQHAERQRQHAEEYLGVADAQRAGHQRDQSGRQRCGDQQDFKAAHAEFRGQRRRAVGADAEKHRVPERQQPGGAEQQIEPEQRDAVADERQHQHQRIGRGHQRQQRHDGDQPEQHPQSVGPRHPSPRHRLRSNVDRVVAHAVAFPNRPAGLRISTTTTTR